MTCKFSNSILELSGLIAQKYFSVSFVQENVEKIGKIECKTNARDKVLILLTLQVSKTDTVYSTA